jgi:hypothetical protein
VPLLPEGSTPYGGVKLALDSQNNAWIAVESRQDDSTTIHLLRIGHDGSVSRAPPWRGRSPDLARLGDGVIVTWNDGHGSDEESAGGLYSRIAHLETP